MNIELKNCIKNVFREQKKRINDIDILKSHQFYLPAMYNKYNTLYTTRWNYIWTLYQTIHNIHGNFPTIYPSLIETVYSMALKTEEDVNKSCTGQIFITHEGKIKLREYDTYFKYSDETKKFDEFVNDFVNRIEECKFTSLVLYYIEYKDSHPYITERNGHANILLIYNDNDTIHIALYEPHGSSCRNVNFCARKRENVDLFLLILEDRIKKTQPRKNVLIDNFIIAPLINLLGCKRPALSTVRYERTSISQEKGIQSLMLENDTYKQGYCMMYSFFWLYLILHCFRVSEIKNITSILINLEDFILEYNVSELEKIITGFAISVYNYYFENMLQNVSEKNSAFFFREFESEFDRMFSEDVYTLLRKRKNTTQRKIPKELSNLEEFGAEGEFTLKKHDGENCRFDQDCLSDNCKEGICARYHSEH